MLRRGYERGYLKGEWEGYVALRHAGLCERFENLSLCKLTRRDHTP